MNILSKAGALAVGAFFVASSAMAATVDITAMDTGGDGVMFTVTNNVGSGQCDANADCISSILFDLTATVGETNAKFAGGNYPVRNLSDRGLVIDSVQFDLLDTADANGETDNSSRNALEFTFAAQDFDSGNSLGFETWIQQLSSQRGGIDDSAAELFAEVTLENGQSASGFFVNTATGKATLSLDFGPVSEVPLPASALLLMGGLAGLGAMRRRKKA